MDDEVAFQVEQETVPAGVDKIFCFIDQDRMCGPACMAFVTYPKVSSATELSKSQTHCALLISADRIGRNTTIIASILSKSEVRQKMSDLDAKREAASRPDGPFASPFPQPPRKAT